MLEALRVDALSVRRGGREILSRVGFCAHHGSLLAIAGPNGAGKSTLLKALLGIVPCEGTAFVNGEALLPMSALERARRLAYVPQRTELSHATSVADVVAQGRFARAPRWLGQRASERDPVVERALVQTALVPLADRAFDTLSGGEQRRVLLARALATESRVLLLDEPTAGLDVAHVLRFYELLRALVAQQYALICVLHDLSDVMRHADSVLLLDQGRSAVIGRTADVITDERLQATYSVFSHKNVNLGFSLHGRWP